MSEAQTSPPVIINITNSSSEGIENANSSGPDAEPAIVVAAVVEQSGVPAIADEISDAVGEISELVDGSSAGAEQAGANGALQLGTATDGIILTENPSDNAVEIAGIIAERDVAIAAIDAETERARDETFAEQRRLELEDLELCKTRLTLLETMLAEIQNTLIPPLLEEQIVMDNPPEPEVELETNSEQNLIPQSTPAPIAEIETAVSEANADAERVPEAVQNLKQKYIRI